MVDGRRRLPVLNTRPGGNDSSGTGAPNETPAPAWHWVPLGAVVTLGVGAVLARLIYLPFLNRRVQSLCSGLSEDLCRPRLDQAMQDWGFRLPLSSVAALVWALSLASGAWLVGRYGTETSARHGALCAMSATLLAMLVQGGSLSLSNLILSVVLIPLAGVLGWFVARLGLRRRSTLST